jgi:pimeloyl-ACP methyl ester carboxylesterase
MSIQNIFNRNQTSLVFSGVHDEDIIKRAAQLDNLYSPIITTQKIPFCTPDGQEKNVQSYLYKSPTQDKKPPLCIILNGIYSTARANDHTGYALSQFYNIDVLGVDYPGKGYDSDILNTKEEYTPSMYSCMLRDILFEKEQEYDDIILMGYSHGTRVIYDLYENHGNSGVVKGLILVDMAPDRPEDAAARRSKRNQHNPLYGNLTEAVRKLKKFYEGHGESLPEDFIINVINHNFKMVDNGKDAGLQFHYDERSMFGYCDEIISNPRMNSWLGFEKIDVPILFLLGAESNTVDNDVLTSMTKLKSGCLSLGDVLRERKLPYQMRNLTTKREPVPMSVLSFEATGHYPEPHRNSHYHILKSFVHNPTSFSLKSAFTEVHDQGIYRMPSSNLKSATDKMATLPMIRKKDLKLDLPEFLNSHSILG